MNTTMQNKQMPFVFCTAILALAASICGLILPQIVFHNQITGFPLISNMLIISGEIVWLIYVSHHQKEQKTLLVLALVLIGLRLFVSRILYDSRVGMVALLLVSMVVYVLGIVDAVRGLKRKLFVIVTISICILSELAGIKNGLGQGEAFCYIGAILLQISVLFLVINNRAALLQKERAEKRAKTLAMFSPETALKQIKNDFELGNITEEEYNAERAKIISEL